MSSENFDIDKTVIDTAAGLTAGATAFKAADYFGPESFHSTQKAAQALEDSRLGIAKDMSVLGNFHVQLENHHLDTQGTDLFLKTPAVQQSIKSDVVNLVWGNSPLAEPDPKTAGGPLEGLYARPKTWQAENISQDAWKAYMPNAEQVETRAQNWKLSSASIDSIAEHHNFGRAQTLAALQHFGVHERSTFDNISNFFSNKKHQLGAALITGLVGAASANYFYNNRKR